MEVMIPSAKIPAKSKFKPTMWVQLFFNGEGVSETACGTDDQIDAILSTIRMLEKQVERLRKNKPEAGLCAVTAKKPRDFNPRFGKPDRPPIKLSFLRTATVSELFFKGIFFPEYDHDNIFYDANDAKPPEEKLRVLPPSYRTARSRN